MDQTGEGKDQKNRHPQQHVQLEDGARFGQQLWRTGSECQDTLRPFRQTHHHAAVKVLG